MPPFRLRARPTRTGPRLPLPRHLGHRPGSISQCTRGTVLTTVLAALLASGPLHVCPTLSFVTCGPSAHRYSLSASDSTARIYSRDALLSLARSPLTSREAPQLAPALLSSCPEIVDGGASGIARALAMGRTPVWHGNSSRGRRDAKKNSGKRTKRNSSLSSESSERSDHSRRTH